MKSEAAAFNEAVFVWNKYPGSNNQTSAGWLRFSDPQCDVAQEVLPFEGEGAQNHAALVEIGLWVLGAPRAHLGSCSLLTRVTALGAGGGVGLFQFFESQIWNMKASLAETGLAQWSSD